MGSPLGIDPSTRYSATSDATFQSGCTGSIVYPVKVLFWKRGTHSVPQAGWQHHSHNPSNIPMAYLSLVHCRQGSIQYENQKWPGHLVVCTTQPNHAGIQAQIECTIESTQNPCRLPISLVKGPRLAINPCACLRTSTTVHLYISLAHRDGGLVPATDMPRRFDLGPDGKINAPRFTWATRAC